MAEIAAIAAAAFTAIKGAAAAIGAMKVLGVTLATWGKIAMWTAMGASMLMKPPGLPSSGMQVQLQPAGPNSPLPIVLGRTGVQGFITYREAYPDAVHNTNKNNKLCFETVLSVGPVKSISDYKLTGHTINWDRNPTRLGSATGVSICRSVTGFDAKSSVWKDGVRAAFLLGEHTDQRTLRDITGDFNLPGVTSVHKMSGLARIVQVYELDGSKNLRFPSGFPDDPQAIVEGIFAYDPRQDTTYPGGSGSQRISQPSTWGWSENPYILALAYILGRFGPTGEKMWGLGADPDDIDIPAFVHGANVADLNVWKIGGMVTTDDAKDAVLSNILVAGAGQYLPGPQISCFVNEPKVSTFTLRQNMLIGDQVIRATRPMKERFNRILVKYREPNSFEVVTGQEVTDAGFVAADGGLRTTETTYPLIQNATQAHQIAAYELVNSREYEVDVKTTAEALTVERGDLITLDFPIGAIESQNFIVKAWSFDAASQTVDMTLVSETVGKHDFALGRTAVAPAPARLKSFASLNPSAPDATDWSLVANQIVQPRPIVEVVEGEEPPVPLDPVTTPAFVFEGEATEPSITAIVVETRPFDANRSARLPGESDVDYAARQEADWEVAFEAAPNATRLIVSEVSPSTTYDVAIRYRSNLNVISPRLVYGGRATGSMSFDWNDPDVITNLPPVLRDTDFLDALKPSLDYLANGLADLENAVGTIDEAVIDLNDRVTNAVAGIDDILDAGLGNLANSVADATAAAAAAQARADGVWSIVGEHEGEGLRKTVLDLVEDSTGDNSQLSTRITGLEQVVNATGGQALARQTDIQSLETAIDGTYAKASDLSNLTTRVTTAEGVNTAQNTRLGTVESDVAGKASASDLTALTGRVTSAEGTNTAQNTRLNTVESDVAGKASASEVNTLKTEVETARNGKATLSAELSSMRTATSNGLTGKANVSDVTALTGRVSTAEGDITATNTRIDEVETDLAGKATTTSVTNLSNEINGARNGSTNLGAQLATMRQTVTDGLTGKASATDLTNLTTRVTSAEGTNTAQNTRLNTVESDVAGKASASEVSTLKTEVQNARNGKANLSAELSAMRTATSDGLAGKASASDLSAMGVTVTGHGNTISAHSGRLTTVEGDVAGKASASSVTSLSNEIVAARGTGNVTLKARIDGLQTTLTDAINLKASASQISGLQSSIDGVSGKIGTISGTVADALNGKASASDVSSLSATVGGYSSSISSAQTVAAEANNRSKAIIGLTSNVNGVVTGFTSVNDGAKTSFKIQSDKFELVPSTGTGARTEFSAGAWKIYDASNRKRIHLGLA